MAKRTQPTNGDEVRKRRLRKGSTQEQLAQESGVSLRKITDIEAGGGAEPNVLNLVAQRLMSIYPSYYLHIPLNQPPLSYHLRNHFATLIGTPHSRIHGKIASLHNY